MRRQWVHVTDIVPTVLELIDAAYPQQINGYRTRSLDGSSFLATLRDGGQPTRRTQQYYELEGNRRSALVDLDRQRRGCREAERHFGPGVRFLEGRANFLERL